jgi:glycosyltransferase involved in cell wall biosynthesis
MRIYAALPVMNEPNLEKTIRCILAQTQSPTALYICVNQPEEHKTNPEKKHIFEQNQRTIDFIREIFCKGVLHTPTANDGEIGRMQYAPTVEIIDKSTIGWDSKNHGVGWARKILMDTINEVANSEDIIISLDADTEYPPTYFESVKSIFETPCKGEAHPRPIALSNPYYHKLTDNEAENRAILRYEIYMRCYHKNLVRIGSPYAFTALGSAMAVTVHAYRKMGGMAPKKSGEDFYFLQQLCKIGRVETKNSVIVYPSNRLSDRVFFGTGPALIKGVGGDWSSYPIYPPKLWDEIANIYQNFESYFSQEDFFKLKNNSKTDAQLQKFCHEKFDGLRILQYLKSRHLENPQPDEISLSETFKLFDIQIDLPIDFSFKNAEICVLDNIRNALML